MEKVNPSLVTFNKEGLVETVSYSELIVPMLKALQEKQRTIELLKAEIEEIKRERKQ